MDQWIAGGPDPAITERLVDALIARRPAPEEFDRFVGMVVNANKAFMGAVLNSAFALDLRPELPKITAMTLIVRGELDAARTRTHVEELLAGIPNSTALEIRSRPFPAGRQPGGVLARAARVPARMNRTNRRSDMAYAPFQGVDVPGPPRDFVGYGRKVPKVRWPDKARVAVSIVLNYEEGSEYSHPNGDRRNDGLVEMIYGFDQQYRDLCVELIFE